MLEYEGNEGQEMEKILYVNLLGGFSVQYEGRSVVFERSSTTKSMQLLQILVQFKDKGVARSRLLDMLYGREDILNPGNNLRVTVHRLKKLIRDAGLPEGEYIRTEGGVYYWSAPIETVVDTHEFERLVDLADGCQDEAERAAYMEQACHLYKGELLPEFAGDEWVVIQSIAYQEKYSHIMHSLTDYLKERREYKKLLDLATLAACIYPFEEWQSVKIDCYLAMNMYAEAMKEYEDTEKLFFDELGIQPSEHMMEQFDSMSGLVNNRSQSIFSITGGLKEKEEKDGAFFCSFPSFKDGYCLVRRMIERNGQSAYLMLITITDGTGFPMDVKHEKLEELSNTLNHSIRACLRRGDSYTKYGPAQYLILLIGTNRENCGRIYDRISQKFSEHHGSWRRYLSYVVNSAVDVEDTAETVKFGNTQIRWAD